MGKVPYFHVPMGLVPFKDRPKRAPEQTSTRPLTYPYRDLQPSEELIFPRSHPAQKVVDEAAYKGEHAPEEPTLEDRIQSEKIIDLISFLRCDTPSTRDIGPFLKDDAERRTAALEICELVDPSMAVKIVYDIIKKHGESVTVSADTLVAAVRSYVEKLEAKQFQLASDVEFRRSLSESEETLPGTGAAASNKDFYDVQVGWARVPPATRTECIHIYTHTHTPTHPHTGIDRDYWQRCVDDFVSLQMLC